MTFEEIAYSTNSWIVAHKELVTVIAVPAITFLVARILNSAVEKRTRLERQLERELARRMKLADFRQAWIEKLRDDLSEYIALTGTFAASRLHDDDEVDLDRFIHSISLASRIQMRMNPNDPLYEKLVEALQGASGSDLDGEIGKFHREITDVGQELLKGEWDRLKEELSLMDNSESR